MDQFGPWPVQTGLVTTKDRPRLVHTGSVQSLWQFKIWKTGLGSGPRAKKPDQTGLSNTKCAVYQQWHQDAHDQLVDKTTLKLETMKIEGPVKTNLISAAKSLFADNHMIWPLHLTMYYLGQIPDLVTFIPPDHGINKITLMRLKTHISSDWHTSSIRLAGCIFGNYQRRMACINNIPLKNPLSHPLHTYISNRRQ